MTTRRDGRSEQVRHLGSVPVAGVEPQAILTRVPPRRLQVAPPPVTRLPQHRLSAVDQAEFGAWAVQTAPPVATVADLKAIEAAEDAVFPPSPALRVKWGRVAAWSPILLFAAVGMVFTARFAADHWRGMFILSGFGLAYASCWIKPAGQR